MKRLEQKKTKNRLKIGERAFVFFKLRFLLDAREGDKATYQGGWKASKLFFTENILTETEYLPGIVVEEGARLLFNVLSVVALLAWMSRCVVNTLI